MGKKDDKQNPNPNPEPPIEDGKKDTDLDKFKKIKENYETKLSDKDKEIEKLKKQLQAKEGEVDETINNLESEVNEKLAQAEKMKELQATVNELVKDKAEATVDTFIRQGKIAPAQRDTALKLCLSDNDTFLELYENAIPIVEVGGQKSKPVSGKLMGKLTNYLG